MGCGAHPRPSPRSAPSLAPPSAGAVAVAVVAPGPPPGAARALRELADAYWSAHLDADPIEATLLGYPGYASRMPDESPAGRARIEARLRAIRTRIPAEVPASALEDPTADAERVTRGLLLGEIDRELAFAGCRLEEWSVDPRDGPQVAYLDLAGLQSVKNRADGAALLGRWHLMPATIDQKIGNLRRGLGAGKSSPRSEVARVLRQLDELLARPVSDWPLVVGPATRASGADWTPAAAEAFRRELTEVVVDAIRPAFARYRRVVAEEIFPRARGDADVGILRLPGGAACYRALVEVYTSEQLDPAKVHQLGLDELARIRREMEALGPVAIGTSGFTEIQKRLRAADPRLFFTSREEVEATAAAALARAAAAMPRFLGRVPRTPCVVKRIEAHEEKDSPIAYYRQPAVDGSRPGTYLVNTYAPETRPRFEAEGLAFHESIPGHHVQIALAQEMTGVPEFQRHLGVTAFVEGWGLYAEGLADELGLYSSPLARLGRLGMEAWRAGRLVVDTGIHALGWSRAEAVQFLVDHTTIARNNIENEVDRYIGWPGQALAYKIGELELRRLRREAERRLGSRFDLRRFHDAVLGRGALSLPVLGDEIARWTRREEAPLPAGGGN
jgi:uncharacterized protein (DUF885 family)